MKGKEQSCSHGAILHGAPELLSIWFFRPHLNGVDPSIEGGLEPWISISKRLFLAIILAFFRVRKCPKTTRHVKLNKGSNITQITQNICCQFQLRVSSITNCASSKTSALLLPPKTLYTPFSLTHIFKISSQNAVTNRSIPVVTSFFSAASKNTLVKPFNSSLQRQMVDVEGLRR